MATQTAYFEDGTLNEFNSVTPAWDKEVNAVADFDSEVDADGDLNDAVAAAHDGATGLEFTFDDANAAYGVLAAGAVNQTTGVVSFWFDPNDVAIDNGAVVNTLYVKDGAGTIVYFVRIENAAGTTKIRQVYRNDAAANVYADPVNLSGSYQNIKLMFSMSTGVGNDDGYSRLYIGDSLVSSQTGLDNDTLDWDLAQFGMLYTNSVGFGGSFYMDTIKIDPVGAPMADKLAAYTGTYGMTIPCIDATDRYGSFTDPTAETSMLAECGFDPNTLVMGEGEQNYPISLGHARVMWYYHAAFGYRLRLINIGDTATTYSDLVVMTDAPHTLRLVCQVSSGVGEDDGFMYLYVDDVLTISHTGLDDDTKSVDTVIFGGNALDAGTYGIFYMDDCKIEFPIVKTLTIKDNDGNTLGSIEPTDATILFSNKDKWFAYDLTTLT